jgi:uncharacterized protein (DUF2147 family)
LGNGGWRLRLEELGTMLRHMDLLKRFSCVMMVGWVLLAPGAWAGMWQGMAKTPVGTWLTANGNAVVRIAPCEDSGSSEILCGWIVGLLRPPGTPVPTDVHGNSQCGLAIITNERQQGDAWFGTVADPRNGSTYGARLKVDDAGNLKLRGYLAIPLLGQTETWRPYRGELGPECSMT